MTVPPRDPDPTGAARALRQRLDGGERDFRSAGLALADLTGLVLAECDLSGANLQGARLDRAELHGTRLARANLRGASLEGAFLVRADLHHADLRGACLRGANLRKAELTGADLTGADLRDAELDGASLSLECSTFDQVAVSPKTIGRLLTLILSTALDDAEARAAVTRALEAVAEPILQRQRKEPDHD